MIKITKIGNTKIQKIGDSFYLLIPISVRTDKDFPLNEDDKDLVMKINKKSLIVERYG